MKTKKFFIVVTGLVILAMTTLSLKNDERLFEISKQLNIYAALFRETNMFYVDDVDAEDMVTKSINGMLRNLDPHTVYYPESQTEDVKLMTTGEYAGIGAIISKKDDDVIIREPYKNSPAHKAGLIPGDIILSIDGISVKGKNIEDVSSLLKGLPGKEVVIKIQRVGESKPIEKKAIREGIQLPTVPYYSKLENNVGYIYLNNFIDKSTEEMRKAILDLKNEGAESFVLDLRGNGGGLLDQAVDISGFFLPKNSLVLSTKGKIKQWDKEYHTTTNPLIPDMPVVVLIDRGSASAAEIVSGALQDYDRAVLIGDRSYGKGSVQTVRDLPYNTKLKITTAKYYIPSGRCVQALDYSNRNPDGSVGKIADSLITEYSTKAGRKVYDGGGVTPDIKIEPPTYSKLTQELVYKDMIFDFVNLYAAKNPTIADPQNFVITDDIFNQFKSYLKENDFSYETATQEALDKLIDKAKSEKYYDKLQSELEKLNKDLNHSIDEDMELFKDEIVDILTEQIIQRYYFIEGVVEYRVKNDPEIAKAIEVLSDKAEYNKILSKN